MLNDKIPDLKMDPVFERLVQPLEETAFNMLESALEKDYSLRTFAVWNGYLLGLPELYSLCRSRNFPVQINDMSHLSFEQAASLLCSEQLKREDLAKEYRKYLIGQLFLFEGKKFLSNTPEKSFSKSRTAYKIGEQLNIAGGTVLKYSVYAEAINGIFDQSRDFALRILLGKTHVSHENVIELSRLTGDELKHVSLAVLDNNTSHLTFSDIRNEVKYGYTQEKAPVSRRERKELKEKINAGIRQMPAFNPDADVNSLCMTINSWISSIERVHLSTNFSEISSHATLELMRQLMTLNNTIKMIQQSLIERTIK